MNDLGGVLAQIAKQLGLTVDHLWPQIVAVTFYTSLAWAILDPLIVIAMIIACGRCLAWGKVIVGKRLDEADMALAILFGPGLIGVTCAIIGGDAIGSYPSVLAGVFAPEGMAALNLLKTITGK